jgi:hypothetical protein
MESDQKDLQDVARNGISELLPDISTTWKLESNGGRERQPQRETNLRRISATSRFEHALPAFMADVLLRR